ncbi:MAG: hypothetical protein ABI837_16090, partial [Acidobacteriota bacterium]
MWKPATRGVDVGPLPVTIEREAVPLIAGGSVMVRWSSESAHPAAGGCPGAHTSNLPLLRAGLLHCPPGVQGEEKCTTIAKTTAPYDTTSSLSFDGVPAGSYLVVLEPPRGKRQSVPVEVVGGRQTVSEVIFPSFGFFGSVKVSGQAVRSRLIFATGQAVSDSDGRYTAALAGDPLDNQIRIEPCNSQRTLTFIPHTGPAPNGVYDIDLGLVTLDVQVDDSEHHPIAGGWVRFSPVKQVTSSGTEVHFGSLEKQTDANGHATFDDVSDGFPLSICARHTDFLRKCIGPVDLKKLAGDPAVLQFDPIGVRGHVEDHTGPGFVAIVNRGGILTEEAQLDGEGKFIFRVPHVAPEYLVYVSANRPMTVLPLPLVVLSELEIQVPAAPVRTFAVTAPDMQPPYGYIGIWVGGMYVPLEVLNSHQELRGIDSVLYRGKSLEIRDIAETGPITVALGTPDSAA